MQTDTEALAVVLGAMADPVKRAAIIRTATTSAERPKMGTVADAAAIFTPPVCTRTVERWARQGAFPRIHLSARKVRYDLGAVERFATSGMVA